MFVFFKQKTAYEMRISDWSSDVCSSDLQLHGGEADTAGRAQHHQRLALCQGALVVQRIMARGVGHDECGSFGVAHARIDPDAAAFGYHELFRERPPRHQPDDAVADRKSTRLNSSH